PALVRRRAGARGARVFFCCLSAPPRHFYGREGQSQPRRLQVPYFSPRVAGSGRRGQGEVEMRRRLDPEVRRKSQAALHHPGLDVVNEVLHHLPAVTRLEADGDGEAVAGSAGPAERGEGKAQPFIEELLHLAAVLGIATGLDHDALAEALVFLLFG